MLIIYSSTCRDRDTGEKITRAKQRLDCDLCHRSSHRLEEGASPAGWVDQGGDVHHCPECVAGFPEAVPADVGSWPDVRVARAQAGTEALLQRMPGHSTDCRGVSPAVGQPCCARTAARRTHEATIARLDGEKRRRSQGGE